MTFCFIEKIQEINLFFFNCNSYFSKKYKSCSRSQLQDDLVLLLFFFVQKEIPFFDEKRNNNKAETNKTPTAVADLTRKSRLGYIS